MLAWNHHKKSCLSVVTLPKVKVVFFASLREEVGRGEIALHAQDLSGVITSLQQVFPSEIIARLQAENVRIAVNQVIAGSNVPLNAGDEVAFLPPVTGG